MGDKLASDVTWTGRPSGKVARRRRLSAAVLATAAGLLASRPASADVLVWDPQNAGTRPTGSDGSGTWTTDQATANPFYDTTTGTSGVVWNNTANANDTALFGAGSNTSSTVNLGTNISAGGVVFNSANSTAYTIATQVGSTLTLTGPNGFTVNTGMSGVTDTVSVPVAALVDQTWTVGANGALSLSNVVSGSVAITKAGAGTLSLGGANTYANGTVLTAGTIRVFGSDAALGTGTLTVATPTANASISPTLATELGSTARNLANPVVVTNNGTGTTTLRLDGGYADLTLSGPISGTGGLAKVSTGNVILAGTNTYAGGTAVAQGTVAFTNGTAFGTGAITAAATANNSAGVVASGNTAFLRYAGTAATVTVPNNIALPAPATAAVYTVSQAGGASQAVTYSGVISGGSATTILELNTQAGGDATSVTALTGANTLVGTVQLNRGSLLINNAASLGTAALIVQTNVNNGTTANGVTYGNVTFTAPLTLTNNITVNTGSDSLYVGSGNNTTLSGVLGGAAVIQKLGSGVLNLTGANTFSGGLNLNAGAVYVTSAAALGSGPVVVGAGATNVTTQGSGSAPLLYFNTSSALTVTNSITLPTTPTATTYYALDGNRSSGKLLLSGTLGGGNANTVLQFDSQSSGDNATPFELSGTNTLTGTVRLNRGRLILDNGSALGTANLFVQTNTNATAGTGNVQFNGTYTAANNISIGTTAGDTFDVPGTNVATLTGVFSNTSSAGWVKQNTGTLVLANAADTYGGVNVNGGTLRVAAALTAAAGPVVVGDNANANTGTLAGTGNTGSGLVTIRKGGTITGGTGATMADTAGNLSTGLQAWNASGTYVAKYDATGTTDRLILSGLTVASGFVVNVQTAGGGAVPAGTYVLAIDTGATAGTDPFGTGTANGTGTGTAALLTLTVNGSTAPAGYSLSSVTDATAGFGGVDLDLVVTAAPEPTSLLLTTAAVAPLLGRRHRRRRV